MRVRFTADYDHRWPSRAVTAFRAGWSGTVKREVAEAAIAKGKATAMRRPAKPAGDAIGNDERPDDMGGDDTGSPDAECARGIRGRVSRNGDGDHPPVPSNQLAGDAQ